MRKISVPASNAFCPQCLYLYGTYKEDGAPNYGLFCWATYCADDGFKFVACIGEDKLTRDRIRANGVFSASIVPEKLLAHADYLGTHTGYEIDKSKLVESEKGAVLNVPVPVLSPWTLELEVDKTLKLDAEGASEIYVCNIKNVRADARLMDESLNLNERFALAAPIVTMHSSYLSIQKTSLGGWGEPCKRL